MQRIQYGQYGGPEVMKLEPFELPPLKAGEIAVKVRVASINPVDWKIRRGDMKMMTGRVFPRAMGVDFAGTVLAAAPDVTRFKAGDAVFGQAGMKTAGALGEAVVTLATSVALKPAALSFEQAAALTSPALTAWIGLIEKASLQAGQQVLVNGCAGGVGEAAVQLALMHGAVVTGTCSARSMERMRALGVSRLYDYRATPTAQLGERFDVVFDTAGTLTVADALKLLKPGGVVLDLHPAPAKFLRAVFDRRLKLVFASPREGVLDKVAKAAVEGRLRMTIGQTVPLNQAIGLVSALESGQKIEGKGLVTMG